MPKKCVVRQISINKSPNKIEKNRYYICRFSENRKFADVFYCMEIHILYTEMRERNNEILGERM